MMIATVTVVVLAPLFLLLALLVVLDGGPLLHREARLGRDGRPFTLCKFRTFRSGAAEHPLVAPAGDARVTAAGRLLRALHLDEIPQLFHVFTGEMSLVGPRPHRRESWARVPPELRERVLEWRPGLTSPATLDFACEDYFLAGCADAERVYREVIVPAKMAADDDYFSRHGAFRDLLVLWRTLMILFTRKDTRPCRERLSRLLADHRAGREDPT